MSKVVKRVTVLTGLCICVGLSIFFTSCTKKNSVADTSSQNQQDQKTEQIRTAQTQNSSSELTVTDMAGRNVTVPAKVDTVYCAVPTAEAMVYSLAPEKLCAWVFEHSPEEEKYLADRVRTLPILGGWMGAKCTANMEEIAKKAPDLIVFMTTTEINSNATQTADLIQKQTELPVVVMDSSFKSTPEVYRKMGNIMGVQKRAERLASWTENKMKEISDMVAKIPDDKLVTVYYAEGKGGLLTDPPGSGHTEVLDFVRGKNIAEVQKKGGQGMTTVSMEQVLLWNPQVILVSSSGNGNAVRSGILSQDAWKEIKAVTDRKVYMVPAVPFNWFDRPPNIMRVIGIEWLAQLLYPDYVSVDFKKDMKEFYSLFLGVTLTDSDVAEILKDAQ